MNLYLVIISYNKEHAVTYFVAANDVAEAGKLAAAVPFEGEIKEIKLEMSCRLSNCKYVGNSGPLVIQMRSL